LKKIHQNLLQKKQQIIKDLKFKRYFIAKIRKIQKCGNILNILKKPRFTMHTLDPSMQI